MTNGLVRKAWTVALAGTGINLALGILYTYSVFKSEISGSAEFAWPTESLNVPYSVCCLVFAFAMILAGRVQDRFGPRLTAFVGGLLVALGFILISFTTSLTVWIVGFGVLAGVGIGFGYSAATPPGLKWFPAWKTGMVAGIVVSGFGLASVYIAPLATLLLGVWGLKGTMLFFGIAFAVVLSALAMMLVNPPAGYDPKQVFSGSARQSAAAARVAPPQDAKPSQILRTGRFWLMWGLYVIGSGAGLMVISDVGGMAKKALAEQAFLAVALLAVGNAAGRIIAGILSDRIGRRTTLRLMLVFQAVLMFLAIPFVAHGDAGAILLVVLATLIGFNYGTNLSLFPALAKDNWGLKSFGANYGLLFTAWGVGGLIFAEMYQRLKSGGEQSLAFVIMGAFLLVAAVMTFFLPGWRVSGRPTAPSKDPDPTTTQEPEPRREAVGTP